MLNRIAIGIALSHFLFSEPANAIEYPDRMCSNASGVLTELISNNLGWILVRGSDVEVFERGGSVGTGLAGTVAVSIRSGDVQTIYYTEIAMDHSLNPPDVSPLILFRDQVFWPCER